MAVVLPNNSIEQAHEQMKASFDALKASRHFANFSLAAQFELALMIQMLSTQKFRRNELKEMQLYSDFKPHVTNIQNTYNGKLGVFLTVVSVCGMVAGAGMGVAPLTGKVTEATGKALMNLSQPVTSASQGFNLFGNIQEQSNTAKRTTYQHNFDEDKRKRNKSDEETGQQQNAVRKNQQMMQDLASREHDNKGRVLS